MTNVILERTLFGENEVPAVGIEVLIMLADIVTGAVSGDNALGGAPYQATTGADGRWTKSVPATTTAGQRYIVVELVDVANDVALRWVVQAPVGRQSYKLDDLSQRGPMIYDIPQALSSGGAMRLDATSQAVFSQVIYVQAASSPKPSIILDATNGNTPKILLSDGAHDPDMRVWRDTLGVLSIGPESATFPAPYTFKDLVKLPIAPDLTYLPDFTAMGGGIGASMNGTGPVFVLSIGKPTWWYGGHWRTADGTAVT